MLGRPTEPTNPPLSLSHQSSEPRAVGHLPQLKPEPELSQVIAAGSRPNVVGHSVDAPFFNAPVLRNARCVGLSVPNGVARLVLAALAVLLLSACGSRVGTAAGPEQATALEPKPPRAPEPAPGAQ